MKSSINNTIALNNISNNNGQGISLRYSASYNNITNNIIENNTGIGIEISVSSYYNNIQNNTVSDNNKGIILDGAAYTTMKNNTLSRNSKQGLLAFEWECSIDTSNILNNKPIYYYFQEENITLNGIETNHITLVDCSNVTISNMSIDNSDGIYLLSVRNSIIEYVEIQNSSIGINASYCDNLTIQNVDISFTTQYEYSIELHSSDGCEIKNVSLSNSPYGGLYLKWCSDFLITYCDFQNFIWGHGIHLEDSYRIVIRKNLIGNNGYGIYLMYGEGCKIYHNNIIGNTNQAYEYAIYPSPHFWNDTYPSGGNYWSDYVGVDEYSGPGQNITGSDGIGDKNITWFDEYPLMEKYDITPPSSSVNNLSSYWHSYSQIITATSNDASDISNITLYYSYSSDNFTWNKWTSYELILNEPWNWNFNFSNGNGYYQYYTVATDIFDNVEDKPLFADMNCGYDNTKPISVAGLDQTVPQNTTVIFNGTASTDNNRITDFKWVFTYGGIEEILHGDVQHFTFNIPGLYDVILNITDVAGNFNTSSATITVLDTEKPVADAGRNQNLTVGIWTALSGYNSTDNVDIVNYSWIFTYNGTEVILYGILPEFIFWTPGDYSIVLNVTDASGNWDVDIMIVSVEELPSSSFDYWWIAIIIAIAALIGAFLIMRKKTEIIAQEPEKPIMETEQCPKCGFDIEAGSSCPFCVEEIPPEPEPPKPKPKFSNEEMLEMIEKSYSEGKLTEEQYLKNKEKFS